MFSQARLSRARRNASRSARVMINGGRAPKVVFTEACYGANTLGKAPRPRWPEVPRLGSDVVWAPPRSPTVR
jgi:hypothetical protein